LRADARRNDFGAGLANPSLLGGLEEFREFFPNRASSSATRPANTAISASRCASSTSNSSTEGAGGTAETDGSTTESTYLRGKSQHGQTQSPATQAKISEPRREGPEQLRAVRQCLLAEPVQVIEQIALTLRQTQRHATPQGKIASPATAFFRNDHESGRTATRRKTPVT